MINPLAIISFFKSEMFKYIVIASVVLSIIWAIYSAGQQNIQDKWDKATLAAEVEKEKLKGKTKDVTAKVEIKYVDRIKVITVKGDTIKEYVDRYVTPESDAGCTIPNNVILLLDAAATNTLPEKKVAK